MIQVLGETVRSEFWHMSCPIRIHSFLNLPEDNSSKLVYNIQNSFIIVWNPSRLEIIHEYGTLCQLQFSSLGGAIATLRPRVLTPGPYKSKENSPKKLINFYS